MPGIRRCSFLKLSVKWKMKFPKKWNWKFPSLWKKILINIVIKVTFYLKQTSNCKSPFQYANCIWLHRQTHPRRSWIQILLDYQGLPGQFPGNNVWTADTHRWNDESWCPAPPDQNKAGRVFFWLMHILVIHKKMSEPWFTGLKDYQD